MKSSFFFLGVLLLLLSCLSPSAGSRKECEVKEKSLVLLDLAKDSVKQAKELIPDCEENASHNTTEHNVTGCGKKEKMAVLIDVALELIDEAKDNYPNCDFIKDEEPDVRPTENPDVRPTEKPDVTSTENPYVTPTENPDERPTEKPVPIYSDCLDVLRSGEKRSGVYTIRLNSPSAANRILDVFCDMDTDGGGWTMLQRRGNFTPLEDFFRDWNSYKMGFGNITRDFWIGNDNIFFLSNQTRTEIRFDLMDVKGERRQAAYSNFSIEDEGGNYRLHIRGYTGNAGDGMNFQNGAAFYTKNKIDYDRCASSRRSGWWFANCSLCNPNGVYKPGKSGEETANWMAWKDYEGLAFMEMKLRRLV